jgi:hypothetical protein
MSKLVLEDINSLQNENSAMQRINRNWGRIEEALEKTLSRDGTPPNGMQSTLDMNNQAIINLPAPASDSSPLRLSDISDYIDQLDGTSTLLPAAEAGDVGKIPYAAAPGLMAYALIKVDGTYNLIPSTNDVGQLGSITNAWGDLFLANAGVINWDNGAASITHGGGGVLTIKGSLVPSPSASYDLGSSSGKWKSVWLDGTDGRILIGTAQIEADAAETSLVFTGTSNSFSGSLSVGDDLTVADDCTVTGNLAVGTTIDTGTFTKIGAGTATVAPVKLTAGTNLTTAAEGALEFDGSSIYFTNNTTGGRGLVQAAAMSINTAAVTLNSDANPQSPFASGADTFTLTANKSYEFETLIYLGTGATSHTTAFSPIGSGTATVTTLWWAYLWSAAAETISTTQSAVICNDTSAKVLNAASTAVETTILVKGIIRCTSGGTIVPQITFSANPTGTNECKANSYFKIWPIGTNTVASIGAWA